MLRTRVGYAGGEKKNPTYYSLGNHTEVISIDYDPTVLSYGDLLKLFWTAHRCDQLNYSRQYMNAVFYHDEKQRKAGEKSRKEAAGKQGVKEAAVQTSIVPVGDFTYAEEYHQKYYLTQHQELRAFLSKTYPDAKSLADSTVAARLNAYLGNGRKSDWSAFLKELPEYGLPDEWEKVLSDAAVKMLDRVK